MKKLFFKKPVKAAQTVLVLDLFVTTLFSTALLVASLIEGESADPPNYMQYMDSLEYIFAGIFLSLVSFVAVDAVARDAGKE